MNQGRWSKLQDRDARKKFCETTNWQRRQSKGKREIRAGKTSYQNLPEITIKDRTKIDEVYPGAFIEPCFNHSYSLSWSVEKTNSLLKILGLYQNYSIRLLGLGLEKIRNEWNVNSRTDLRKNADVWGVARFFEDADCHFEPHPQL